MCENTWDNRTRFMNLLKTNYLIATNTTKEKPTKNLCTFREPGTTLEEEWNEQNYAQLDYVCFPQRWKNALHDVTTDPTANIPSDHIPIIWTTKIIGIVVRMMLPPRKNKSAMQRAARRWLNTLCISLSDQKISFIVITLGLFKQLGP